ncbi:MAG: hypothetical protein EOO16_12515 [Chitinophagaceae bacterium]|nr:MAG: hypothetical protein EOO16_12515 [Chitinophagaceae bacterium]
MRIFLAAVALTLLAHSAMAEYKIALVEPKNIPLIVSKVVRKNELYAEFKGTAKISGTLVAEWSGGKSNLNYQEPDYSLVPDSASIKMLPHFSGYRVRFIELQNGREALALAAGHAAANRLLARKITQIKITGSFNIRDYVVGVECDASWAKAKLVSADVPDPTYAAAIQPIETC